jgi:hypothetical protein
MCSQKPENDRRWGRNFKIPTVDADFVTPIPYPHLFTTTHTGACVCTSPAGHVAGRVCYEFLNRLGGDFNHSQAIYIDM